MRQGHPGRTRRFSVVALAVLLVSGEPPAAEVAGEATSATSTPQGAASEACSIEGPSPRRPHQRAWLDSSSAALTSRSNSAM